VHYLGRFALRESTIGLVLNPLEELTALHALHDHQEALPAAIGVLVHIDDVHNVPASADPPMEIHLAARLLIIQQHLEGIVLFGAAVGALHHLSVDPETQYRVRDLVVVHQGGGLRLPLVLQRKHSGIGWSLSNCKREMISKIRLMGF